MEFDDYDDRPRRIGGRRLLGWSANPPGDVHSTVEEAKGAVERVAPFPIAWLNRSPKDSPPEYWGAHPAMVAHWAQTNALAWDEFGALEKIRAEIGDASYHRWTISAEFEDVLEVVEDAEFPHLDSKYFALFDSSGTWSVWESHGQFRPARRLRSSASREEALVVAGEMDYANQPKRLEGDLEKPIKPSLLERVEESVWRFTERHPDSALFFWSVLLCFAAIYVYMKNH